MNNKVSASLFFSFLVLQFFCFSLVRGNCDDYDHHLTPLLFNPHYIQDHKDEIIQSHDYLWLMKAYPQIGTNLKISREPDADFKAIRGQVLDAIIHHLSDKLGDRLPPSAVEELVAEEVAFLEQFKRGISYHWLMQPQNKSCAISLSVGEVSNVTAPFEDQMAHLSPDVAAPAPRYDSVCPDLDVSALRVWSPGTPATWREHPIGAGIDIEQNVQKIVALKTTHSDKKLALLIGRHVNEDQPKRSEDPETLWIYGDLRVHHPGEAHVTDAAQIIEDFSNPAFLNRLASEDVSFSSIVFDYSVFKFFRNRERVLHSFHRLLVPGGSLYFDAGDGVLTGGDKLALGPSTGFPSEPIFDLSQYSGCKMRMRDLLHEEATRRARQFCLEVIGFKTFKVERHRYPVPHKYRGDSEYYEAIK